MGYKSFENQFGVLLLSYTLEVQNFYRETSNFAFVRDAKPNVVSLFLYIFIIECIFFLPDGFCLGKLVTSPFRYS